MQFCNRGLQFHMQAFSLSCGTFLHIRERNKVTGRNLKIHNIFFNIYSRLFISVQCLQLIHHNSGLAMLRYASLTVAASAKSANFYDVATTTSDRLSPVSPHKKFKMVDEKADREVRQLQFLYLLQTLIGQ